MEKPKMPVAQLVYGEIVYWLVVVSAIICMIGPLVALFNIENNLLNPHYLFSSIWAGKSADQVWLLNGPDFFEGHFWLVNFFFGEGGFQGGHFWLRQFTFGDGLTQFGLVMGCAVAMPALIGAAIAYLVEKPRQYLWVILALWVATLVAFSALGIVGAGH
ncbi:MAG: hypothetical protein KJ621_11615 [Proteobacteria bacterium]|nr:hypothetical protein [Pseudomonadota bacterium]MBU1743090.1 hypothetical protein [Pseudomonadota bacterium]